jgi:hypothetical protein
MVVVLHEGWLAATLEFGRAPLYFWPYGTSVREVVEAAGVDVPGGTLEEWQATMARVSAALIAAGFLPIPRGAEGSRQALTWEEEAEEASHRGD